jgi:PAS domain S-box-containing protein
MLLRCSISHTIRHFIARDGAGILLVLLLAGIIPAAAQDGVTIRSYTMEDGLPTANVRMLLEDSEGFIWCGSEEGLLRFDGHRFRVFRSLRDATQGLNDNSITRLFLDHDDRLWVHTRRALHRYDPVTQSFERYPYTERGGKGPGGRWDRGIMRTSGGQLWVRTDRGMNLYDPVRDRFIFYPHHAQFVGEDEDAAWAETENAISFVSGNRFWYFDTANLRFTQYGLADIDGTLPGDTRLHSVHTSSNGICLVTSRGLHIFSLTTRSFHRVHRSSTPLTSAVQDGSALWCSMPDLQLLRYDLASGALQFFPPTGDADDVRRTHAAELTGDDAVDRSIRLIAVDSAGALWAVFPDNTLFRYLPGERRTIPLVRDVLRGSEGFSFLEDRSGTVWFTAPGHGILHIERHPRRFTTHAMPFMRSKRTRVETNNVRSFLHWNTDTVFVATLSGMYYYLTREDQCRPLQGLPDGISHLAHDAVWAIARDRQDRLWIGTGEHGLIVYDPRSGDYMKLSEQRHLPQSVRSARMRVITMTEDGRALMGTWDGGFVINADSLDLRSRRPVHVARLDFFTGSSPAPVSKMIMDIEYDRQGRQWIGTDRGLSMTDPATGQRQAWNRESSQHFGLISDDIRAVYEDRNGRIWLGTHGGGLLQFDPYKGTRQVFDVTDGLPDNIIYSIQGDTHGNLWMGTHRGICRLDPMTGAVRKYHESDGLQDYEFNTGASLVLDDGRLLFGGVKGFNVFHPDSIHDLLGDPSVVITRMLVLDAEHSFGDGEVELPHDQNYLTFEFAALSHYRSANNRYAYMLEGVDRDWVYPDDRRVASYSDLEPGTYVFRVIACNSEGRWNMTGASVPLVITPAWWESPWAYVLYLLIGGGLIVLLVRVQQRRAVHRERMRSEVVAAELRAQTAEARAKALSAENEMKELELKRAEQLRVAYDELERTTREMQASREQVEKLSRAVHQSPSIVIITDTRGAIEYVNPKFTAVTGYSAEEVTGKNPRLLKSSQSPAALYRRLWRTLASGEEWRGELENRRKDGSSYWVLTSISPLKGKDDRVTHYIGIQEDITERKKTEQILARRTEELETVDRIVAVLNGAFDLRLLIRSLLEQGMILLPQAANSRILMHDQESDALVLADAIGYQVDLRPGITVQLEELLRGFRPVYRSDGNTIRVYYRPDGAITDGDCPDGCDATSLIVMSARFDGEGEREEGYLLFDNGTSDQMFGEEDARRLLRYREHAVTALAKARTMQALKQKNETLLRTQEQLVVQQKLASLGQLTAGIAHEIRNPLNFISNFSLTANELVEEIQAAIDLGDDVKDLLGELSLAASKIHEHGMRANRIVEGMLLHARSKQGEVQLTPVNRLVQEATHLAYHGMRASIPEFHVTVEHILDPEVESVQIIPQEVSRVILSLLDNAFYAVWKKHRAQYNGSAYTPVVSVRTAKGPRHITINIRDNGGGMPEDIRRRVFEPFYTTKPAGEGTGLGLSLSHEIIVKQHGGSIEVMSEEGSWTEFMITLPMR